MWGYLLIVNVSGDDTHQCQGAARQAGHTQKFSGFIYKVMCNNNPNNFHSVDDPNPHLFTFSLVLESCNWVLHQTNCDNTCVLLWLLQQKKDEEKISSHKSVVRNYNLPETEQKCSLNSVKEDVYMCVGVCVLGT